MKRVSVLFIRWKELFGVLIVVLPDDLDDLFFLGLIFSCEVRGREELSHLVDIVVKDLGNDLFHVLQEFFLYLLDPQVLLTNIHQFQDRDHGLKNFTESDDAGGLVVHELLGGAEDGR